MRSGSPSAKVQQGGMCLMWDLPSPRFLPAKHQPGRYLALAPGWEDAESIPAQTESRTWGTWRRVRLRYLHCCSRPTLPMHPVVMEQLDISGQVWGMQGELIPKQASPSHVNKLQRADPC
ncbi:uncharacterized protein ACIB01_012906 [Guaruba guarouba]